MEQNILLNDMVVRFANVNGTGSASANDMFTKAIFRMGIPVTAKNIFPSNIQGLPTWFEVRVSEKGYLARRDGIDILVGVNPQSMESDIESIRPGGFFIYDNTKPLHEAYLRPDIQYIGIPMIRLAMEHFDNPRLQQLLKNMIYVGALATLIDMDLEVLKQVVTEQFNGKEKLVSPNFKALELGIDFVKKHFAHPIPLRLEQRDSIGDRIMIDGNTACALGAIYAGATVMAWYPITPSTSVAKAFEDYCKKLRVDPATGKHRYASIQAEDELAAIGMVIGAMWNGARAFTATSGPGVSLMNEFIGLSYFAEIPVVLINVQRGGPSTGMPTRTQQADLLSSAYASHGDTRHPMLLPASPSECFDMTAEAFDLAERLQTLVFVMSDLDLGMNSHLSEPLRWDKPGDYDRGKVLSREDLEEMTTQFGRYLDTDGDGIPYRTIPGTHPTRGAYFTRGTSHDEFARYTENGDVYARVMDRLLIKWDTAKSLMPKAEIMHRDPDNNLGLLYYGSMTYAALEAIDQLADRGILLNSLRVRAFPFGQEVSEFISQHDRVIVLDQNRDGQMRTLLINELNINPERLQSLRSYNGYPLTADFIREKIMMLESVTITQ